jgi:hypothetical protein
MLYNVAMYKVSARQVEVLHEDDQDGDAGIILSIEPPIELNADVVFSYLTYGLLKSKKEDYGGSGELHSVQLLGSTDMATSIYVGSNVELIESGMRQSKESIVELIALLGSTATLAE